MATFSMLNSRTRLLLYAAVTVMRIQRKRKLYKKKQIKSLVKEYFSGQKVIGEFYHLYQTLRDSDREFHYRYITMSKERFDHLLSLIWEKVTKKNRLKWANQYMQKNA